MSIIDELIELLEKRASKITIPRIKRVTVGLLFVLIELENGISGLAFNPIKKHIHSQAAGKLTSFPLLELIKKASLSDLEKTIGIAAINTMSQLFLSRNDMKTDIDIVKFMNLVPSDKIGMIGNMVPLVKQITGKIKSLTIIEENQDRWEIPKDIQIFSNYKDLPDINKLLITGSAILSDEFDEIINTFQDLDILAIVGPTMGSLPEPFFKRRVNAIGGMTIKDPIQVQKIIMEGGGTQNFKKYCEKYLITNN